MPRCGHTIRGPTPRESRKLQLQTKSLRSLFALLLALLLLGVTGFGTTVSAAADEIEAPADPELAEPARALFPAPPDLDTSSEDAEQEQAIPGRYIVVLDESVSDPGEVAQDQVSEVGGDLGIVYDVAFNGYVVDDLSSTDVAALNDDPLVDFIEPDRKTYLSSQKAPTGISRISALQNPALDIDEIDDARVDVDVVVVDGRVDRTHPDLNVVQSIDCVPSQPKGEPICHEDTGEVFLRHATKVAGIIGAIDNGFGVVGAAPGARIRAIRVFDDNREGRTSWTNAAIEWIAKHADTIDVANMSLGGAGTSDSQNKAIADAAERGVVPVVAAGNQSENAATRHPANSPDVITVSALADYDGKPGDTASPTCGSYGDDDTLGTFSNWGSEVELAAPGVCIRTTDVGGGYADAEWGTSYATPYVSGAAAVLASADPPETLADVESIRQELIDAGSLNWSDTSYDGAPEPALYLGDTPLTQVEAAIGGWSSSNGTDAVLAGALNTRGAAGQYEFEYGPTTSYGNSASGQVGQGTAYLPVSRSIGGLEPGHTYHYRLAVTTAAGTVYSPDRALTTPLIAQRSPANGPAAKSEYLNDVWCLTVGDCIAAGYHRSQSNENKAGVYRLTGGQWNFTSLPQPAGSSFPQIFGITCSAANACTAVGRVQLGGNMIPLAERWNGSTWSIQTVPLAYENAQSTVLNDVSCASQTECMAVGYYKDSLGVFVNFASLWKGGTWTSMSPPNSEGAKQSMLEDVSCVSGSQCTAVGWINTGSGSEPVIATWNGSSWSLAEPARSSGTLYGISCVSSTFCAAVGGHFSAETWNGKEWSSNPPLEPNGARDGYLEGISCTSSSYCAASGAAWYGSHRFGLMEVWDGSSWEVEATPRDAEEGAYLSSVGCVPLGGCSAVGGGNDGTWHPMILQREDVVTAPPADVLPGQADLNGTLNPGSISTTYKFEFGKTTAYGTSIPVSGTSAGSGTDPLDVSKEVKELEPETTYHYRLSATNKYGTTYGKDVAFRSATPGYHLVRSFGSSGSGKGQVDAPWGLDIDLAGNLWVADRNNNRVEKYSPDGLFLLMVGGEVDKTSKGTICTAASGHTCGIGVAGSANGQFREPLDVAVTATGDILVTDGGNDRVQKLNSNGEYISKFGSSGTGSGQFTEPWGIDTASNGDIWVSDATYFRIERFNSGGTFIQQVGGFEGPRGLEVDSNGHVWVTERTANRVRELGPAGEALGQFGAAGTGQGQFDEPQAVDVKTSGDVLVTDRFNDRVQQFSAKGVFVSEFGNGQVIEPRGVVDAGTGTVYVSNSWKDRIDQWQQNVPRAITGGALEVGASAASLSGTVNPAGKATEYRFEYGKTTSYGSSVENASAGSGTSAQEFKKPIAGLEASTTYHYRIVATSSEGTIFGKDGTFTTKPSIPKSLGSLAVIEPFNGSTESLANFSSKWSTLGWAGGASPKGTDTTTGWRAVDTYATVNGTSYNPTITDSGSGIASVATLSAGPGSVNRYFSLWLDMPTPTGAKSGYELRFTYSGSNTYTVTLAKWSSGSSTTLASQAGVSFSVGNSAALVDQGNTVSAWTNTGSGFAEVLGAADATYSSGGTGVEAAGNSTRLTNFKTGGL
jgi:subtilisin family serine protease